MTEVRVVPYDEVDPFSFKLPTSKACDFSRSDRFQTVAIDGDRLVGRWSFTPNGVGGPIWSSHTWVSGSYRRQGLARRLWLAGVEEWAPSYIEASIASWTGAALLASMKVRLAGHVELRISCNDWRPTFESLLAESALREVVRLRAKPLVEKPRLEVVG